MLPCPDCNNPLTQFPIEKNDVDLVSCDSCYGVWLVHPGDDLERVDNVAFDDLVEAYGTEYPIDVDPSTVKLPEEVEDALMQTLGTLHFLISHRKYSEKCTKKVAYFFKCAKIILIHFSKEVR